MNPFLQCEDKDSQPPKCHIHFLIKQWTMSKGISFIKTVDQSHKPSEHQHFVYQNWPPPPRSGPWPSPIRTRSWSRPPSTSTITRPWPTPPPPVHFRVIQWWTPWTTPIQVDNFYRVCIWAVENTRKVINKQILITFPILHPNTSVETKIIPGTY